MSVVRRNRLYRLRPCFSIFSDKLTLEAWVYANEKTGGSIIGSEGSGDNGIYGLLIRLAEGVNNAIDFTIVNGTWSSCITQENSIELKNGYILPLHSTRKPQRYT